MSDDAGFNVGDTVILERSASIPTATVRDVFEDDGELKYRLSWSNGNTNIKLVDEIDRQAVNVDE